LTHVGGAFGRQSAEVCQISHGIHLTADPHFSSWYASTRSENEAGGCSPTLGEEVLHLDWVGSGGCCPRQPRACVNQLFLFSRGCPMMDDHLKGGEHVLPGVAATRFEWCRASPKSWTGRGERDLGEQVSLKTTEGVSAAWMGSNLGGPEPGGTAGGGMLGWGEEGIFLGPCPDQSLDGLKNKGSPVIQPLPDIDIGIGLLPSFGGRQP